MKRWYRECDPYRDFLRIETKQWQLNHRCSRQKMNEGSPLRQIARFHCNIFIMLFLSHPGFILLQEVVMKNKEFSLSPVSLSISIVSVMRLGSQYHSAFSNSSVAIKTRNCSLMFLFPAKINKRELKKQRPFTHARFAVK